MAKSVKDERFNEHIKVIQRAVVHVDAVIAFHSEICVPHLKSLCDEFFDVCSKNLYNLKTTAAKKTKFDQINVSGTKLVTFINLLCQQHEFISGRNIKSGQVSKETTYGTYTAHEIRQYCKLNCPSMSTTEYVSHFTHYWLNEAVRKLGNTNNEKKVTTLTIYDYTL